MISEDELSQDPDLAIKEFNQILRLANLNETRQIAMAIKLAYFPFAGRVLKNPDDKGLELLNEYAIIYKKIKQYLEQTEKATKV